MKVRRIKDVRISPYKINRRKRRAKRILRATKCSLVMILFAMTIVYAALSPFFNIDKFEIKESMHYDNKHLMDASRIQLGRNGFRTLFSGAGKFYIFRIGFAEHAIEESCPYIKTAKVRYVIPSTVSIEVEEREAAAILRVNDVDAIIDEDGFILEFDTNKTHTELPVIIGIKPDSPKLGKKVDVSEEILLSAFKVFDTISEVDRSKEDKLLPEVDFVNVGDLYNVSFSLQSRVIVNLGEMDDLYYKINAAQTIFTQNIKSTERGKLDFSSGANPVFTPESRG